MSNVKKTGSKKDGSSGKHSDLEHMSSLTDRSAQTAGTSTTDLDKPPAGGKQHATLLADSRRNRGRHSILGHSGTADIESDGSPGLDSLPSEQFLAIIGFRVRAQRAELGMSRKALAKKSGVSERYLAQLESGKGNISIVLLRKVTQAIDITMEQLLHEHYKPVELGNR